MSDPFIVEIRMFGGNFAPIGWLLCQGQTLPISGFEPLFTLIGTTYGGDGVNTFVLPDLRSRLPVHQASTYPLGAVGGAETVVLTSQNLPAHSHSALAANSAGTASSPTGNYWASGSTNEYSTQAPNTTMNPAALSAAGGNQPHDNMPPFLVINFIIATEGIFPSQS
jgi:microcystin-dependent protein